MIKFFKLLLLFLITAIVLIAVPGCSWFDPANKSQVVRVNLIQGQPETVEGKYLLRFDVGGGKYLKLNVEDQGILLIGADIETPQEVNVQVQNTEVNLTKNIVTGLFGDTESEVYELKTKLTIAAALETTAIEFKKDVVAHFPAVPSVRDKIGAQEPSTIPEVRFEVSNYTRYNRYGAARLIPDIISSFWPGVGVFFVTIFLIEEYSQTERSIVRKIFSWLVTLVVIGVAVYFLFFIVRDLWWIVSG